MKSSPRRRKQPANRLGRALTALIIGAGLSAIALSFFPGSLPALPARGETTSQSPADSADLTLPALPAQASRTSDLLRSGSGGGIASEANPVLQPTPRPIIRDAPPTGTLSAVGNARGISTGRASDQAASAPPAPFSIVLALENQDPLQPLALAIAAALQEKGVNAALAPLSEAGRPDAILALNGIVGSSNETWFCDPGPEQSIVLATELLQALGSGEGGAPPSAEPQSDFPCQDIHAGRARVPAVLLELANGGTEADSVAIAEALRGYFGTHRGVVLAARAAPRLIWPALGPVTSHYDTSHPLGIDIGLWEGPVVAATDGVVTVAGGNPCCSYGFFVLIEGDVLGEIGCTGTCFGAHLHFEVWQEGVRQNPMRFLD